MATVPWTVAAQPSSSPEVVFLASRLDLRAARDIPGFLLSAMKIRRQVRHSAGALGLSLQAQPLRKTFWTLSAWTDQSALDAFVGAEPHLGIMTRYHDRLIDPQFASWTAKGPTLPKARSNAKELWAEGKRRLAVR